MEWCNKKLSRKFYLVCKKCEDDAEDSIIEKLEKIVSKCDNKFDDININYTPSRSEDFPLKFIFKFTKPKTLKYIMDNFINHEYESIDWLKIDSPILKNNILHHLISDINDRNKTNVENAISIINLLFYSKEEYKDKLLPCFELLYLTNDYNWTPSEYSQQRKLIKIGSILENVQFKHIYQIICIQCQIPDVIALIIIQYSFQLYHIQNILDQIKINSVDINQPKKSISSNIKKIKKYRIGEIYFRYDEINDHIQEMIEPNRREMYLENWEFEQIFGMTKRKFVSLFDWTQKQLKREHGLF